MLLSCSADLEPEVAGWGVEVGNSSLALFGVCGLTGAALACLLLSCTGVRKGGCALSWGSSGNSEFVCSALVLGGRVLKLGRGDDGGLLSEEASPLAFEGETFVLSVRGIGRGSISGLVSNS